MRTPGTAPASVSPNEKLRLPLVSDGRPGTAAGAGEESVPLTTAEMPSHTHTARASADNGNAPVPVDNHLAAANNLYQVADPEKR